MRGIIIALAVLVITLGMAPHTSPYYIETDDTTVLSTLEIRHQLPGAISADLTPQQARALERRGIAVEPVGLYHVTHHRPGHERGGGGNDNGGDDGDDGSDDDTTRSCTPTQQEPWGVSRVGGSGEGEGITVAVLDTGVMQEHLDLTQRITDCHTTVTRFRPDTRSCEDGHGHGTHVAGTVLADAGADGQGIWGVAPQANLMAVKVCDRRGNCYGDDIAAGIQWAADNGADIISMSLGGTQLSSHEHNAITHATEKGLIIIASAGNSGSDINTIRYPAADSRVISVAATDNTDRVADFSSRGVNDNVFKIENRYLELSAPGVSVESAHTDGCYRSSSGTSMAAPHVAGLAAKYWSQNSEKTASDVREQLWDLTEDITDGTHARQGYDPASGLGLPVLN